MKKIEKKLKKLSKTQMQTVVQALRLLQTGTSTAEKLAYRSVADTDALEKLLVQTNALMDLAKEIHRGIVEALAASEVLDHIEKVSREQRPKHLRLVKD